MKNAVQTSRFQYMGWATLIVSFLIVMISCGGPTFTPIPRSEIRESDQIRLYLSVSDTLFPRSVIEQYSQEGYANYLEYVESLVGREGPQLYVWVRNTGDGTYLALPRPGSEPSVGLAYLGRPDAVEILYARDGEWINRDTFRHLLILYASGPCEGYGDNLTYVGPGESVAFPWPFYFLDSIDYMDMKPGLYEVSIILQTPCINDEDERPVWIGRAQSNTVSFRIAE